MSAERPLRVALVGCGRVARSHHLPALARIDAVRIVALADRDERALAGAADAFGVTGRYRCHEDLLARAEADIVAVCVPVEMHEEVAGAALDSGRHVFVEKPLTLDAASSARLLARARRSVGKVAVGFHLRHHRHVRRAVAALRGGALGEIEAVRTDWTSALRTRATLPAWRDRRESGGGVLFELGAHCADLWRHLLDEEIDEVHVYSRGRTTIDETAVIAARTRSGVAISALLSERGRDRNETEIVGRDGSLCLSMYRFDGLRHLPREVPDPLAARWRAMGEALSSLPHGIADRPLGGVYRAAHHAQWLALVDAIRHDREPVASLEDGHRAVCIIEAALESAASGRPVRVAREPNGDER